MTAYSDKLRAAAAEQAETRAKLIHIAENILPKVQLEECYLCHEHTTYADARVIVYAEDLADGFTVLERANPCNIYRVKENKEGPLSFRPSRQVIEGEALPQFYCADLVGPYLYRIRMDWTNELQAFAEVDGVILDIRVRVKNDPLTRVIWHIERDERGREIKRTSALKNDSGYFTHKDQYLSGGPANIYVLWSY